MCRRASPDSQWWSRRSTLRGIRRADADIRAVAVSVIASTDEKRETAGGRKSEGDGLNSTGVVELNACRPLDGPPQWRCLSLGVLC